LGKLTKSNFYLLTKALPGINNPIQEGSNIGQSSTIYPKQLTYSITEPRWRVLKKRSTGARCRKLPSLDIQMSSRLMDLTASRRHFERRMSPTRFDIGDSIPQESNKKDRAREFYLLKIWI